jgi:hypothetical protein
MPENEQTKESAKERAETAAANGAKAAEAKAVTPCPIAEAAKKAEAERIEKKYDEISQNGHAVQRHGAAITPEQLEARSVRGVDPASGTTNDAYNRNPDGSAKKHNYGRHATKFNDKDALVKADEKIRTTESYKKELERAAKENDDFIKVDDTKLEDIYGKDYKTQVTGKSRIGSKNKPTGSEDTNFTDGTVRAVYKKDDKGNWNLETMFPEPKSSD